MPSNFLAFFNALSFRCGLVLLALFSLHSLTWAQGANQQASSQSDVRLVIDVSGSMKRNDPSNLRQPSVDLLMRLLPDGSKAGVWTFGKYVNMLVPHRQVDEAWRQQAQAKAQDINSVGLYTNIGEALEKAAYDMDANDRTSKASIILLTDGMVDIDKDPAKNTQEWQRIVDEALPKLKAAGYTVHTVALSDNADRDLMEKLALGTDGLAEVAKSSEELMQIFLKAFDVAVPSQQVPLEGNSFVVDSSVEEFTALIFRQIPNSQTELVGPDEARLNSSSKRDDVSWYRADNYDLVTIKQPLEGEWQVNAAIEPGSRVTVVSDLTLKVKPLPNNVFRGAEHSLNFALLEDGQPITRPDFLKLLVNSVNLDFSQGEQSEGSIWHYDFSQEAPPSNGVYQVDLPVFDRLGEYQLQVLVDGKTFRRQLNHRITVREPFSAELGKQKDEEGLEQNVLTVRSHSEQILPHKTQIAATITSPKRRKKVKPLGLTDFENWQTIVYFDEPGEYHIQIQVTGEDARGEPFEYLLEPMTHNYNPDLEFAFADASSSESSSSEQASSSSEASSSVAPEPAEESPAEPPAEEAAQDPAVEEPASEGLPPWVLYAVLGAGNLLILGGGYFLFRKLFSDSDKEELDDDPGAEEAQKPVVEDEVKEEAPPPEADMTPEPEIEEEIMAMDEGGGDDEEPPMEDLDPVFEPEMDEEPEPSTEAEQDDDEDYVPEMSAELEAEAEAVEEPEDDDYGVDDIEEEPDPEPEPEIARPDDVEEGDEDFAQEMLKAQGLDLGEDELDDAISNLIDELDEAGEGDDQDDFDDFGLDDDDPDKN